MSRERDKNKNCRERSRRSSLSPPRRAARSTRSRSPVTDRHNRSRSPARGGRVIRDGYDRRRQNRDDGRHANSRQEEQDAGRNGKDDHVIRRPVGRRGRSRSPEDRIPVTNPRDTSYSNAEPQAREAPRDVPPPAVGSIQKGTVHTIKPFGIFIALEDKTKFEKADEDETKVKTMDFYFPRGQEVYLKISAVEPDGRGGVKINGSMRAVSQEDGSDHDLSGRLTAAAGPQSDEPPEAGLIYKATVKRIEAYGVFVQLDGFRRQGLVHSSQVSNYLSFSREDSDEEKKAELAGVVAIGDMVYVKEMLKIESLMSNDIKVVEVTEDESGQGCGPKIGCSIKLVDQTSGEDMDPNGLRYKPRGEAGAAGGGVPALGAAAGQVIGGKIDWGHLAGDNRLYVEDKSRLQSKTQALPPPMLLPPPPPGPRTVEEALAIIEQYSKHKDKKDKSKKGKKKNEKKKKKSKKSKTKHKSRTKDQKSSSSGSDSD